MLNGQSDDAEAISHRYATMKMAAPMLTLKMWVMTRLYAPTRFAGCVPVLSKHPAMSYAMFVTQGCTSLQKNRSRKIVKFSLDYFELPVNT